MDELGIIRICDAFQLDYGRVRAPAGASGSRNISVACPLAIKKHGDPIDGNKSCSIEVVDDGPSRVRCFSGNCGFKGLLVDLVKTAVEYRDNPQDLLEVLKDVEQTEALTGRARNLRARKKIEENLNPRLNPRDRDVLPESVFEPFAGSIPKYAIERGIQVETAKSWGLGYDKEGGYLVFPVRRRDGKLVGLVGRAVSDRAKRRHHNYVGLDKSKHMFGAHMLVPGKPVVIVESCIDALNTWQALRDEQANVVATLGEGFSDTHVSTLTALRSPFVYIFTDGDQAGRLMGNKIAYAFRGSLLVKVMECPWGPVIESDSGYQRMKVDPSILPYDYIRQLYRRAPVVRKKIKWTNPPPIFDPRSSS